ncbi:F-box only protein 31-like [Ptychodera flava]|uniref:F-box only protein 31-like n=1 Tax=Ptychodera flava TaxID=63121 RepID=UPI00396A6FEF
MANILMLPPELLTYVLSFLHGTDLPSVSLVCKRFKEAVDVEWVWQKRCKQEYGVDSLKGWKNPSYRTVYTKILHHYGFIFGIWQPEIGPYGGLVHISVVDGSILATQLLPPCDPNVTAPLRKKPLFSITLNDDDRTEVRCLKGPKGPHKCIITSASEETKDVFCAKCCKPDKHRHPGGRHEEFRSWLEEELGNPNENLHDLIRELLLMKFMITNQYETVCHYKKIVLPVPMQDVPIQPGLFKGTYGSHGVEIVNVSYKDDKIHGTKVTGDPNVPACQLSIEADLNSPMVLTAEQQETLAILEGLDMDDVIVRDQNAQQHLQPFKLPSGVSDRGLSQFQEGRSIQTCRARYFGTGLIASHGFMNSSRTLGHLVIFDDNFFGFLWLELRSLSVYSRVHDKFD